MFNSILCERCEVGTDQILSTSRRVPCPIVFSKSKNESVQHNFQENLYFCSRLWSVCVLLRKNFGFSFGNPF